MSTETCDHDACWIQKLSVFYHFEETSEATPAFPNWFCNFIFSLHLNSSFGFSHCRLGQGKRSRGQSCFHKLRLLWAGRGDSHEYQSARIWKKREKPSETWLVGLHRPPLFISSQWFCCFLLWPWIHMLMITCPPVCSASPWLTVRM